MGIKSTFSFYRGAEKKDFIDEDIEVIRLFQIHLSNVLAYYGDETDSTSILFMLQNYNCVGVGILDSNYNIISCNSTFKQLTAAQKTEDGTEYNVLNKVISLCRSLNNEIRGSMLASSEYKFDEVPLFLEVNRMSKRTPQDKPQFSCLIYDLSYFFKHTLNQAKEKYILTPREFEVLNAVLKGNSNEEIAKDLYLSLPTVNKYLASIYGKMEIKNQKQIFDKLKLG